MIYKERLKMKFKMNVPNTLTMIRIFCTPLMILMFLLPIPKGIGVFIALGIYVLACITDWLDGYIARKYNMITDFGKFMDQIADKFITTTLNVSRQEAKKIIKSKKVVINDAIKIERAHV